MKKVFAILLTAVFLCTMFTTVAFAASSVTSEEYTVNGTKSFTVTTDFAPKHITFEISESSGTVVGFVTVDKPGGGSYNNFVSYSGDDTITKRVYNAKAGTYTFHFANSGSVKVRVTISSN